MTPRYEFFGGPKDGETIEGAAMAVLRFPEAQSWAQPPIEGAKVHRYEWRAQANPAGYYYAGVVRL